jgi:hypothetical protein
MINQKRAAVSACSPSSSNGYENLWRLLLGLDVYVNLSRSSRAASAPSKHTEEIECDQDHDHEYYQDSNYPGVAAAITFSHKKFFLLRKFVVESDWESKNLSFKGTSKGIVTTRLIAVTSKKVTSD